MDLGAPNVETALRALPALAAFCRRLGLAEIIARLCAVRDVAIAQNSASFSMPRRGGR